MRRSWPALLVIAVVAGCGGDAQPAHGGDRAAAKPRAAAGKPPRPVGSRRAHWPRRIPCPPDAANCRSARGSVIYVEAVDPDGDGDAHLVLASSDSVTGPGIAVIDVEKPLRPHPLPRLGDLV